MPVANYSENSFVIVKKGIIHVDIFSTRRTAKLYVPAAIYTDTLGKLRDVLYAPAATYTDTLGKLRDVLTQP